jgi:lipopolysaccharide export LptBFGC system permease protein LptF
MRVVCVIKWTRKLFVSFFASRTNRLCFSISMRAVNERTRDWKTRTTRRLIEFFVIKRTTSFLSVNVVFQKKRSIYKNKQRFAHDAQTHIYENAFVTLLRAVTTFFSIDARDTNMSKVNRQTLDASNAHQIRQFDMWRNATIMHRRRKRRTYVSKDHDNKRELMNKFFIDDYFARST